MKVIYLYIDSSNYKRQMSYVFYNQNDLVYVKNIGYGKLINCGKFNSVSVKTQIKCDKDDDDDQFYFDPRLFLLPGQTMDWYTDDEEEKKEPKLEKNVSKEKEKQKDKNKKNIKDAPKPINLVTVQLEGTQVMVHTPSDNIKKHVSLSLKPAFGDNKDIHRIQIQINKTIQSLKKLIFEKLGLKIAYYYNIKLFSTSPFLQELNIHSKTIIQCGLREQTKIIVTAQHGFCFKEVHPQYKSQFTLSNNDMTFVSIVPKKVQKVDEKKNQSPKKEVKTENEGQNKDKKEGQIVNKKEQEKKELNEGQNKDKKQVENGQKNEGQNKDKKQGQNENKVQNLQGEKVNVQGKEKQQKQKEEKEKRQKQQKQQKLKQERQRKQKEEKELKEKERIQKEKEEKERVQKEKEEKEKQEKEEKEKKEKEEKEQKQKQQRQKQAKQREQKEKQQKKPQEQKPKEQNKKQNQPKQQLKSPKKAKKNEAKEQMKEEKKEEVVQVEAQFLQLQCDETFSSGKSYWELKLDKISGDKKHVYLGYINEEQSTLWGFNPLTSQKLIRQGENLNSSLYGTYCKQDESIGVYLEFSRSKVGRITFYKNSICLGTCFEGIKGKLRPVVGLGGNCQVSLFSKVDAPIDTYRYC